MDCSQRVNSRPDRHVSSRGAMCTRIHVVISSFLGTYSQSNQQSKCVVQGCQFCTGATLIIESYRRNIRIKSRIEPCLDLQRGSDSGMESLTITRMLPNNLHHGFSFEEFNPSAAKPPGGVVRFNGSLSGPFSLKRNPVTARGGVCISVKGKICRIRIFWR